MQIIVIVTDQSAGIEVNARLAPVQSDDGQRWLGHTLSTAPAPIVLQPGVTLAAAVDAISTAHAAAAVAD